MHEIIITGASRGIGAALARALGVTCRLVLVARDAQRLQQLRAEIARSGGCVRYVPGDLSSLASARELGQRLLAETQAGATLVHNAGIWPTRRVLSPEGLESAFVVNHLGPLAMQEPLIARGQLARILVVSAGLIAKGRFDAERTPTGRDFSGLRTYCNTKLCFAAAMRKLAADHAELDTLVLHPGVVRTQLGARPGVLGALLSLAKRRWEAPETCATRLARILHLPRWSEPGKASFWFEERSIAWPAACGEAVQQAVWETSDRLLRSFGTEHR
jgi:NAD(P)-dependent dehydrogenase (short-subunit alcohol dehydrogenase family)